MGDIFWYISNNPMIPSSINTLAVKMVAIPNVLVLALNASIANVIVPTEKIQNMAMNNLIIFEILMTNLLDLVNFILI